MLRYTVEAQVGGKLAQLGARLVDSAAKVIAGQGFARFAEQVQMLVLQTASVAPPQAETAAAPSEMKSGNRLWLLQAAGAVLAIAVAWLLAG